MDQLTVKKLRAFLNCLHKEYDSARVYLGDDDELNGIHSCWSVHIISKEMPDFEVVKEINHDGKIKLPAILLS